MLDYDKLVTEYVHHRAINPLVLKALTSTASLSALSSVLEVGCGTGNYIGAVAQACEGTCWGVDPSREMLAAARSRQPTVDFQLGPAEALPFEDDSFDFIYSVDVIHHVSDMASFFREAHRVLKPGGRLCTATDSADNIGGRRPLSSHFPETVTVEMARYPAIERLIESMTAAGFDAINLEDVSFAYPLTDIEAYRRRAFSCLHLIDKKAFERGIMRLEADLAAGPIEALSLYTLLWGRVN